MTVLETPQIRELAEAVVARAPYRALTLQVAAVEAKGDQWWYVVVQPISAVPRDREYYAALRAIEDEIEAQLASDASILVVPVLPPED